MTTQSPEFITLNGVELATYSLPLERYPNLPKFYARASYLRRGYIGTWEVHNDKLYLTELWGIVEHPTENTTTHHTKYNFQTEEFEPFAKTKPTHLVIDLNDIFPNTPKGGIFADWFSGEINIGQGEVIAQGLNKKYAKYLILTFGNGALINDTVVSAADLLTPKRTGDWFRSKS